jgi:hypothetical protein
MEKVQKAGGTDSQTAFASYKVIFNEPLEGAGCSWKLKLNQKEFKDGLMIKIFQRKHESLSNDLIRTDA